MQKKKLPDFKVSKNLPEFKTTTDNNEILVSLIVDCAKIKIKTKREYILFVKTHIQTHQAIMSELNTWAKTKWKALK
jgi:hypothetical protein